jgi:uncharacterized protein YjiS (DUF1127 family)
MFSLPGHAGLAFRRDAGNGSFLVRLSGLLALWATRQRERRMLATLDDRTLCDLGVGRAEAAREAGKAFWEA